MDQKFLKRNFCTAGPGNAGQNSKDIWGKQIEQEKQG